MSRVAAFLTGGKSYDGSALLALRIFTGVTLLLKHGWMKVFDYHRMATNGLDPLHIGAVPSLILALISDFVCSILIVLGLGTRWAALWAIINITVAWATVEHFQFFGRAADHGEAMILYLGALIAIALAGAGPYSLDALLTKRRV